MGIRAWLLGYVRSRVLGRFELYDDAVTIRARILDAIVDFYDHDPTDDILMMEPQELTDHIMVALFTRQPTQEEPHG